MDDDNTVKSSGNSGMMASAVVIIIVILIVAGLALIYQGGKKTAATNSTSTAVVYSTTMPVTSILTSASTTLQPPQNTKTPVAVTDPPEVPAGTSALVVAYSSVSVKPSSSGVAGTTWVNASGSGSINLMNVTNSSRVVGYANLSTGESVSAARINVTSAYIIVNGTKYNVTVPGQITSNATASSGVASNSAVLVVVSPVVAATYNQNKTSFAMATSSRALIWQNATAGLTLSVGTTLAINGNARASIDASAPNITIASANLSASGNNMTMLKVRVDDNSNSVVRLTGVELYGPENISTATSAGTGIGIVGITATANVMVGVRGLESFQEASFVVSPAGTLELASNSTAFSAGSAVVVNPKENLTLTFSGVMGYDSGLYKANIKSGTQYRVVVVGEGDAVASSTVTGG